MNTNLGPLRLLGVLSTLGEAALAGYRGRYRSALFLVALAAVSTRVTGLGVVGSLGLRLLRRL